jgi:hypothetical protein
MIKRIHQIWIQGEEHFKATQPAYYEMSQLWKTLYPDFEYKLWNESDFIQLLSDFSPDLLTSYQQAPNFASKSDIARYVLLYTFGGLYVDTDYEPFKRCDFLFLDVDLVLVRSHLSAIKLLFAGFTYNQAFIYSGKLQHDFFANLLTRVKSNPFRTSNTYNMEYTLKITGPHAFMDSVYEMKLEQSEKVRIVPHCMIEVADFSNLSASSQDAKTILNKYPYAVGVHRLGSSWTSSALNFMKNAFGTTYDCICEWSEVFLILLVVVSILLIIILIIVSVKLHKLKKVVLVYKNRDVIK